MALSSRSGRGSHGGKPRADVGTARYRRLVAKLTARERAELPDRAFAYVDSAGRRRLPIHDEAHVRNALARFDRVDFEDDGARERARRRLLNAARRFGILPVGFVAAQLRPDRGSPDFSKLPTGSVTFLMTDIERSTRLAERLGDRYAPLLKDVRALIGDATRRRGGRRVDSHGDEYLTVFETPAGAVQAAIEIQRALAVRRWPGRIECRVRAGIHTGRPTLSESGYVGLAINTVSRVCYVGHGGQIVVSSATRTAVARLLPDDVAFLTLGRHRLPGLSRAVSLYQVRADGLSETFAPLRLV
jgi:class 3 adenylate cyclase